MDYLRISNIASIDNYLRLSYTAIFEDNYLRQDLVFSVKLHIGLIPYTLTLDPYPYPYPLFLIPVDLGKSYVWVVGRCGIVLKGARDIVPKGRRGIVLKGRRGIVLKGRCGIV